MCKTIKNEFRPTKMSPAFSAATELRRKKGSDYGGIAEYFPFGDESFTQMIYVKVKRLVALVSSGKEPTNESIDDNLLDLINYASYYYEWRQGVLDE
jgi:hypothetical protein